MVLRSASIVLATNSGAGSSIFEEAVRGGPHVCFFFFFENENSGVLFVVIDTLLGVVLHS
jgi:hypothetical protein